MNLGIFRLSKFAENAENAENFLALNINCSFNTALFYGLSLHKTIFFAAQIGYH